MIRAELDFGMEELGLTNPESLRRQGSDIACRLCRF